jgi:hypothetical protein
MKIMNLTNFGNLALSLGYARGGAIARTDLLIL